MSHSGLLATTPDMLYAYYNKLNRRVIADLLAVDVASFIGQVEDPSEGELQALYEEAKDRFASPISPEPGFKRGRRIAFGYLAGTFGDFLQREMDVLRPTITDEQIQQYYDERRETDYKVTELPVDPDDETGDDLPPLKSDDEAAPPATAPSATEPPATAPPVTAPPQPGRPVPSLRRPKVVNHCPRRRVNRRAPSTSRRNPTTCSDGSL